MLSHVLSLLGVVAPHSVGVQQRRQRRRGARGGCPTPPCAVRDSPSAEPPPVAQGLTPLTPSRHSTLI